MLISGIIRIDNRLKIVKFEITSILLMFFVRSLLSFALYLFTMMEYVICKNYLWCVLAFELLCLGIIVFKVRKKDVENSENKESLMYYIIKLACFAFVIPGWILEKQEIFLIAYILFDILRGIVLYINSHRQ